MPALDSNPYWVQDVSTGQQYGISPDLLSAQQYVESGWNPAAVSPKGAFGISQFLPSTAQYYGVQPGTSQAAVDSQINGEANYMSQLYQQEGSWTGALEAYNAGPNGVANAANNGAATYASEILSLAGNGGGGAPKSSGGTGETTTTTTTSSVTSTGFLHSFEKVMRPSLGLNPFSDVADAIDMAIVRGGLAIVGLLMVGAGLTIIVGGTLGTVLGMGSGGGSGGPKVNSNEEIVGVIDNKKNINPGRGRGYVNKPTKAAVASDAVDAAAVA